MAVAVAADRLPGQPVAEIELQVAQRRLFQLQFQHRALLGQKRHLGIAGHRLQFAGRAGPPAAAGEAAAAIAGASKVLVAEDASLGHRLAENTAQLIASLAGDYEHIVAPATTDAKNVLPRVAALLDVMVITDVSAVVGGDTFERPVYAGNAIQTVKSGDSKKVVSIRTSTFEAAGTQGACPVGTVPVPGATDLAEWVEDKLAESDRPELTSAKIVVSGGRGVGSEESFAIIGALADKLGAAVGASRAAVDSGFAPNDWQVGQTGKVVAPELYIAAGISGAIQHLAGSAFPFPARSRSQAEYRYRAANDRNLESATGLRPAGAFFPSGSAPDGLPRVFVLRPGGGPRACPRMRQRSNESGPDPSARLATGTVMI